MVKADKSKAIVQIKTEDLNKKFQTFITDNNIKQINKDPTGKYQTIIQNTLKRNKTDICKTKTKISYEHKT